MRGGLEFVAANLPHELGLKNIDAGEDIGALVFGGDYLAAGDFHGDRDGILVAMGAINFGDDNFGDDVFFVAAGEVAVELADALGGIFAKAVLYFIITTGDFNFFNHSTPFLDYNTLFEACTTQKFI